MCVGGARLGSQGRVALAPSPGRTHAKAKGKPNDVARPKRRIAWLPLGLPAGMALHVSQQRPNDKVFSPFAGASPVVAHGDGTILTTINQGNVILGGSFPSILFWKIPLTYCVPYCVSTFSQLRISHVGWHTASEPQQRPGG